MNMRPEILYTRLFKERFLECLSRHPTSLQMAVPYIGKVPPFGSIVKLSYFSFSRGCESFRLITRPPNSGTGTICLNEAELITAQGAEVMIRTKLHSKVYQFTFSQGDRAAFVGSANLTTGGFERNDETVAFFCRKEDNDAVADELERLEGPGTYELGHWKYYQNQ